jgi:hypothetical protein
MHGKDMAQASSMGGPRHAWAWSQQVSHQDHHEDASLGLGPRQRNEEGEVPVVK